MRTDSRTVALKMPGSDDFVLPWGRSRRALHTRVQ